MRTVNGQEAGTGRTAASEAREQAMQVAQSLFASGGGDTVVVDSPGGGRDIREIDGARPQGHTGQQDVVSGVEVLDAHQTIEQACVAELVTCGIADGEPVVGQGAFKPYATPAAEGAADHLNNGWAIVNSAKR